MKLKNEKGAVTLFVLVSCLFFLTSVACVNMYLSSKQSAVNKEYQQIKKNYENDLDNASNIYNDLKNRSSSILPEGLTIGTRVTYTTNKTSSWSAELYSSTKDVNTENVTLQTVSSGSVNIGNVDMSISSWKVLSIDNSNHTVELISSSPSPNELTLCDPQGYNNAVYLLNNTCNELYGRTINKNGKNYTITGRNLNIFDIEKRMTDAALNTSANAVHKYTDIATWGTQYSAEYTGDYKYYPSIYASEYNSVINGIKNTNNSALDINTQINPIHRTDSIIEPQANGTNLEKNPSNNDGKHSAQASIQPYQTYYKTSAEFMLTAFKAPPELVLETDATQNTNYKMLMLDENDSTVTYWLSSRCIDLEENLCTYRIFAVHDGHIRAYRMYNSGIGNGEQDFSLRPVITVNFELISGNVNSGFVIE